MISSVTLSAEASSQWIPVDYTQTNFNLGVAVVSTGTSIWKVEVTADDPFSTTETPNAITAQAPLDSGSSTNNEIASITIPCRAIRLTIVSYTSGSVKMTVLQGRN
jgi:hypothetical protein